MQLKSETILCFYDFSFLTGDFDLPLKLLLRKESDKSYALLVTTACGLNKEEDFTSIYDVFYLIDCLGMRLS